MPIFVSILLKYAFIQFIATINQLSNIVKLGREVDFVAFQTLFKGLGRLNSLALVNVRCLWSALVAAMPSLPFTFFFPVYANMNFCV